MCRYAASCYNVDLTFDFAIVSLTLKSSLHYILETVRCTKLIFDIGHRFGTAGAQYDGTPGFDLWRLGPTKSFDYRPLGIDASFDLIGGH